MYPQWFGIYYVPQTGLNWWPFSSLSLPSAGCNTPKKLDKWLTGVPVSTLKPTLARLTQYPWLHQACYLKPFQPRGLASHHPASPYITLLFQQSIPLVFLLPPSSPALPHVCPPTPPPCLSLCLLSFPLQLSPLMAGSDCWLCSVCYFLFLLWTLPDSSVSNIYS